MKKTPKSLRQTLILPFVLMVMLLAVAVGWLSYRAGSSAVETLAGNLLSEKAASIEQAVTTHLLGVDARMGAAMPVGLAPPPDIGAQLEELQKRFWIASTPTSGFQQVNVIFGNTAGQFFGMLRQGAQKATVRIQLVPGQARQIFELLNIQGPLISQSKESNVFDARQRPWFLVASKSESPVWTDVYSDFITEELVITRARQVVSPGRSEMSGVVAVDATLTLIQTFVQSLETSANGLAFLAESNGALIATSKGPHLGRDTQGRPTRLFADKSGQPLIEAAWARYLARAASDATLNTQNPNRAPSLFDMTIKGEKFHGSFFQMRNTSGLNWTAVVVIPESDLTGDLTSNAYVTMALGLLALGTVVWLGFKVVNGVVSDIHTLSQTAHRIGAGELNVTIPPSNHVEMRELSSSLASMQDELTTDQLTGLTSRGALVRYMTAAVQRFQTIDPERRPTFALLFLDLNRFKAINDKFGHAAGDLTLIEVAKRVRQAVRNGDNVARFGGDEFLVVLWRVSDPKVVDIVCAKIQKALEAPIASIEHIEGAAGSTVGTSIGCAYYPADGDTLADLIKLADSAMYSEKSKRA